MSESVIADFVGKFNADSLATGDPITGRILCSQKRLVLAHDDEHRATIPLTSVYDVAVGHVPPDLEGFFDSAVTVAYRRDDRRHVAVVEADDEKIEKFSTVLFKALLNGTDVSVQHPANVGGRATDAEVRSAKLFLGPAELSVRTADESIGIELATITDFSRADRDVGGRIQPAVVVRHVPDARSMTTVLTTVSGRELSLLGRYLRLEYSELMADLADVDLSPEEGKLLIAVYSGVGGTDSSLSNVLDVDASQVTTLRNRLAEGDLLVDATDGTSLTRMGQAYVNQQFGDVDA